MPVNSYQANTWATIAHAMREEGVEVDVSPGNELNDTSAIAEVEQRRFGRFKASKTIFCSHGKVLDVSSGGVRVLSKKPLEGSFEINLGEPGNEVEIEARVAWCKQHGRKKYEVGLELQGVTPQIRQQLCAMARSV